MPCFDGFEDDMWDLIDPQLLQYWLEAYGQGFGNGHFHGQMNGFDQASNYYHLMQQMQMAQRMQMMQFHGNGGMMRYPRRRARLRPLRGVGMRGMIGGGVGAFAGVGGGFGGRAVMGSPFGMGGNQLAIMGSPWGGG